MTVFTMCAEKKTMLSDTLYQPHMILLLLSAFCFCFFACLYMDGVVYRQDDELKQSHSINSSNPTTAKKKTTTNGAIQFVIECTTTPPHLIRRMSATAIIVRRICLGENGYNRNRTGCVIRYSSMGEFPTVHTECVCLHRRLVDPHIHAYQTFVHYTRV